jgi:phospholipid/cholesterol/gamma-HCH transport system permease protein
MPPDAAGRGVYVHLLVWRRGQPVRLQHVFEQMRQVGVDAIPIVLLLSLTVGLMLGHPVHRGTLSEFGAQPGGARLAKSVTREFGVLITGIVVAGRSGSAFAARIGSMSVSQEVDALGVMGSIRCVIWWRRRCSRCW